MGDNKMKISFNMGQLKVSFTSIVLQSLSDMWEAEKLFVALLLLRLLFVGHEIVYHGPIEEV